MTDNTNRRKFPRIPKIFLVSISHDGLKEPIPAMMVDISLGGMKALTKNIIEHAREIVLTIVCSETERVEIPAKVIWVQKFDIMSELSFGVNYMNGFEFRFPREEVNNRIFEKFGIVDFLGWTDDVCDDSMEKQNSI